MSIYYWLYVLLQAPFLSTNLAGCSGTSCVNNADWEGCDFSFFLSPVFVFFQGLSFFSRGNLGRRMVEESTKIQDSDRFVKKHCLLSLFSFSTSFWSTCLSKLSKDLVASRFPLNDAGRAIVATLAARILEDPQGPGFIRWTWPPIGMVGRLGVDTKSCLFTS